MAKRFVFEGVEAALGRKKQENYHREATNEVEARNYTIACSEPPEGRSRWTMQLIAVEGWCITEASAEFVAKTEDVFGVY